MTANLLSIRELAKIYKMSERNLKKLIVEHNITNQVQKGKILVNVRAFDSWIASNIKTLSSDKLGSIEMDEKSRFLKIAPMLSEKRIIFNPPDSTKMQILTHLVRQLVESGAVESNAMKPILRAVVERERLCSTAIMDGVAIPHPRSCMKQYIKESALILAISKRGIDFESDDGKKTNLFFLICTDKTELHLKKMARLSRLLRSAKFRHELIISENFSQVQKVFSTWEKKLGNPGNS